MRSEIEWMRGLAILALILQHILTRDWTTSISPLTASLFYLAALSSFIFPMFLFISGYVLTLKYYDHCNILNFYKRRGLSVLPAYFAFTYIYLIWPNGFFYPQNLPTINAYLDALMHFSFWHLWFFAPLLTCYLLFPATLNLYKLAENHRMELVLLLSVVVLQLYYQLYIYGFYLQGVFYFVLGIYVCRNSIKLSPVQLLLLLIGCFIVSGIMTSYYLQAKFNVGFAFPLWVLAIVQIFFSSFVIILAMNCAQYNGLIFKIGKVSFGIYLIHILVLATIIPSLIYINVDQTKFIYYPIMFIGTLLTCCIIMTVKNTMCGFFLRIYKKEEVRG